MGGWVDYTPMIEPLRGPTCMLKTSKISTQVEIASWARVWQKRTVNRRLKCFPEGRSLAISHDCKYVEVSAALDHNVDTLLVGIVKQIRLKMTVEKQRPGNYER